MVVENIMSADGSGYISAFQDFVQANSPPSHKPAAAAADTETAESQSSQDTIVSESNKQSSSGAGVVKSESAKQSSSGGVVKPATKRRKLDSDDDLTETESDVANDTDNKSDDSEPPAVPKRLRTHRSAKQKILSKLSTRGRQRGSSSSFLY